MLRNPGGIDDMTKRFLSILGLTAAVAAAPAAAGETYTVDPSHSFVGFSARHFGVSTVRGEFERYDAEFVLDEEDPTRSSIVLRIQADSIDTDHERRDGHLKSPDFLDVANHPTIVFESRSITARGDGEYLLAGDLTMRGVTRPVEIPVTLSGPIKDPYGNMRVGVDGELEIDRQDWGVAFGAVMDNGGLVVSNEVKISFSIEGMRPLGG